MSERQDSAVPAQVVRIDPEEVEFSELPNRDESSFQDEEFFQTLESIRSTGGNVVPVKLRRKPGNGEAGKFEVIHGHKRIRACQILQLPVLAMVTTADTSTSQVLSERIAENTGRSSFKPIELGRICATADDEKLFPNLRAMQAAFGIDMSQLSKALMLARLPAEVVAAFPSPGDLQYRHAKPLTDAVQKDRKRVIEIATELQRGVPRLAAKEVMERLTCMAVEPFKAKPNRPGAGYTIKEFVVARRRLTIVLDEEMNEAHTLQVKGAIAKCLAQCGSPRAPRTMFAPTSTA